MNILKTIRWRVAMNVLDARNSTAEDELTYNSIVCQAEKFLSIINMCNRELDLPHIEMPVLCSQKYLEQIVSEGF